MPITASVDDHMSRPSAAVSNLIHGAFASLAARLDAFSEENSLPPDEMMMLVNGMHTDFAYVYAKHVERP